jgi:hypothetical protein
MVMSATGASSDDNSVEPSLFKPKPADIKHIINSKWNFFGNSFVSQYPISAIILFHSEKAKDGDCHMTYELAFSCILAKPSAPRDAFPKNPHREK